jgi:Fe-S-cluster formation regulator IscX/YfhJ
MELFALEKKICVLEEFEDNSQKTGGYRVVSRKSSGSQH